MKTRLILAMLSLCFFYVNISNAQKLNNAYVNDEYKYSIVFPLEWEIEPREEEYHVITCSPINSKKIDQGVIKIIIRSAEGVTDLELIPDMASALFKKFIGKDFKENNLSKIKINGKDFILYDYCYNYIKESRPGRQRNVDCYYIENDKLYMVMFWGNESYYEKNKDIIMKSIESFKLLK